MTITAKVIEDSISEEGVRLTTFEVRFPRFVHAELLTHRMFSRNASSSRAIPVKKLIADIHQDPAMPVFWGANQSGMQAKEGLTGWRLKAAKALWMTGMYTATTLGLIGAKIGMHKQLLNRVVENFGHITVVITATNFSNFYALRRHEDAQPEIKVLADSMFAAQEASTPKLLRKGEWHLPYVLPEERPAAPIYDLINVSGARCARTSYKTFDGRLSTLAEDLQLCAKLIGSAPLHASPFEHQATPDQSYLEDGTTKWVRPELHGNFYGWCQNRKFMSGECQ